ncbi:Adaptin N terminal region family protein [Tritrichomonas foetus]|uniref:Adaptin N terminal region family protein n=1 Tax=Tritrichomonas foetus TaxID=1144522 RepID=A0A1J4KY00_9EUKA|nr:Adaptin N terminal region family protein [Tritrichomonas foetus]|eukprot:OHT16129.1 Adaptin N terminal region family protein [Tritrichomonas foetus]
MRKTLSSYSSVEISIDFSVSLKKKNLARMSNLGAIGSQDFENPTNIEQDKKNDTGPISLEDQKATTIEQISKLIVSTNVTDRAKAMKMLIAMMSKGHDVQDFAPFVVQQVASSDPQCRQLAYIFLNHYASECMETVLLSINTFQRSLTDNDPIIRALAVKMISSVPQADIIPEIQSAVEQVIGDPSPYVKKAAAFAIIKAAELDPNLIDNYLPFIDRLLGETNPIAFSGAIAAYWSICPENIEFIHPRFRFICQNIQKFDEYAQVFTLRALSLYTRLCFKNPSDEEVEETEAAFWDENPTKENISSDHLLIISAAKKCLNSPNPAVVLAAVSYIKYCAPLAHLNAVARPLVRLLYENPLTAQISLTTILTIATGHAHVFVPHLNHFYVRKTDNSTIKRLKLRVLTVLASPSNADMILSELAVYTGSNDSEFAALAVKTMGKLAMINQTIIPVCLVSLLKLMGRAEGKVLAEVVLVMATILRLKRRTDDEAQALRSLCRKFTSIKDPAARAAVLSIVGDMHETHPEFAPQLLRYIAQNFADEPAEVRLQSLTLAAKLIACGTTSQVPMYLLKICERDNEFDVRDRARFLLSLVESKAEKICNHLKELLFPERQLPKWTAMDTLNNYQIGTFSHFYEREVPGYDPMIDWAPEDELPDDSVRQPMRKMPDGTMVPVSTEINDDDNLDINNFFNDEMEYEEEEEEAGLDLMPNEDDENVEYYEYEEEDENPKNDYDNFFD